MTSKEIIEGDWLFYPPELEQVYDPRTWVMVKIRCPAKIKRGVCGRVMAEVQPSSAGLLIVTHDYDVVESTGRAQSLMTPEIEERWQAGERSPQGHLPYVQKLSEFVQPLSPFTDPGCTHEFHHFHMVKSCREHGRAYVRVDELMGKVDEAQRTRKTQTVGTTEIDIEVWDDHHRTCRPEGLGKTRG